MRSFPFWLMMVSTATAVLPVCLSPMISSRWPRPIGTIESIAFRPVCTGCDTDFLQTTPGATFSMTSVILAEIGPLPSIGWPSEFTTRPSSSGPTGTSRMRPVHLTASPSEICSYSPMITAPTESRSRFKARPKVSFGNSSISPCITSDRPWTRQMPSVTVTTVPCVRMSAESVRLWIRLRIRSLISDGLSCCIVAPVALSSRGRSPRDLYQHGAKGDPSLALGMTNVILRIHSSRLQRRGHVGELAAHRAVDHFVADDDAHAADQLLVHGDARLHPAPEAPPEVRHEAVDLGVVQRKRGADLGLDHALAPVLELLEQGVDLRQQRETVVGDQHAHEIPRFDGKILLAQRDEQLVDLLGADVGVGDARAHLRMRRDLRHRREHVPPPGESARLVGEAEHGLGIGPGDGDGLGHGYFVIPRAKPEESPYAWRSFASLRMTVIRFPA